MADSDEKVEFLNSVPTPIVVVDREFTVTFMNPAVPSASGGPQRPASGRSASTCSTQRLQDRELRGRQGHAARHAWSPATQSRSSHRVPCRSATTGRALKDASGTIVGALEYVLDISKEVEITTALSELAEAAVQGQLDFRADVDKFEGNYQTIVRGVNETVDALLEPINEAAAVLEKVAQRELTARVTATTRVDTPRSRTISTRP